MTEEVEPKIVVKRHDHYRDVIINGIFGGHRPGFIEAVIYTEEMLADKALSAHRTDPKQIEIQRTIQFRLIMDPVQAKSFAQWLNNHITLYEKAFGRIIMPEEAEKKLRSEGISPE